MTPITPNVMANPIAASTRTEPRLRPKNSVSIPEIERAACVDRAYALRLPPCGRLRRVASATVPSGALLDAGAASRFRTSRGERRACGQASDRSEPHAGIGIVQRVHGEAGFDLRLHRPIGLHRLALCQKSDGRFIERPIHVADRGEANTSVRARERKARERDPQSPPHAIVRGDSGELIRRRRSNGLQRDRIDERPGRKCVVRLLDDDDRLVVVARVQAIVEEGAQSGLD